MEDFIFIKWDKQRVIKKSGKPFKSGSKVANGFCINPNSKRIAFTFNGDDSVVDVHQCKFE